MICPKCGLQQAAEEIKQCNNCGATFSKITISFWESAFANEAELWWQEPRSFSKIIEPGEYIKLAAFILIATSFSYVWARKLSTNPFLVFMLGLGIAILAVIALKLIDSSSPKNIYMTPTEIVHARGREHRKIQYKEIKECLFIQDNQGKNGNHLEITTSDVKLRVIGIPVKLEPSEVMAALNTHDVNCELRHITRA